MLSRLNYTRSKVKREILKCGARVCIEKPLSSDVLLAELEAALRR